MVKTRLRSWSRGGGTNLQALLDAQAAGRIPHGEIALVVSNREGRLRPGAGQKRRRPGGGPAGKDFEARLTRPWRAQIEMIILRDF